MDGLVLLAILLFGGIAIAGNIRRRNQRWFD